MLFFLKNRRRTLAGSGILTGYTDWHCHLLPGVDDGASDIGESLAILREYERCGISRVWLTPHIMEDIPNSTPDLKSAFERLKMEYDGPVELRLASENMLDNLFLERLEADDLLPLGEGGRHLLVETSYFNPPAEMDHLLKRIREKGYIPVLAHPERYVYMDMARYGQLFSEGVLLQLNLFSLVGRYGPAAREKALKLLKNGMYALSGSDTHSLAAFRDSVDGQMPGHLPEIPADSPL